MQEKREAFSSFYEIYTMCNKSVISNQVIDIYPPPPPKKKMGKMGQNASKGLVTNYGEGGGGYKTGGGAREVIPLRKGGGGRKKF